MQTSTDVHHFLSMYLGLAVVGAYQADQFGIFKENMTDYPYEPPFYVTYPLNDDMQSYLQNRYTFTAQVRDHLRKTNRNASCALVPYYFIFHVLNYLLLHAS